MKIFKIIPNTVVEYSFDEKAFSSAQIEYGYSSGVGFHSERVGISPLVTVNFELKYSTQEMESTITDLGNNIFHHEMIYDEANEQSIIYFESTCAFQFESDDFDADITSLTDFLSDHYQFAFNFISKRLPASVLELETDTRARNTIESWAHLLIEQLRLNRMYFN